MASKGNGQKVLDYPENILANGAIHLHPLTPGEKEMRLCYGWRLLWDVDFGFFGHKHF